jgi:hypothetical protein
MSFFGYVRKRLGLSLACAQSVERACPERLESALQKLWSTMLPNWQGVTMSRARRAPGFLERALRLAS